MRRISSEKCIVFLGMGTKLPNFDGWQTYPENLEDDDYRGHCCHTYREQLRSEAKRLFVSDSRIFLKVFELGERGK